MTVEPYPTAAGRPPNICGNCGQQWWGMHVCPNLIAPMAPPLVGYPLPPSVQMVDKGQLDKANVKIEFLRDALKTARDFIAHHPAVHGEWPLVLQVIDKALE